MDGPGTPGSMRESTNTFRVKELMVRGGGDVEGPALFYRSFDKF